MIIDELVVTLGLDPTNFTKGQKDALESFNKAQDQIDKRLQDLEHRNKNAGRSFGDMTNAAEGLFTALAGGGMLAFAHGATVSAAATGRMATNIGIATGELSAFGRMIERNGGSAEAAAGSMKSFTDSMQRAMWGQASPEFLTGLAQVDAAPGDSPLDVFFKLSKFAEHNTVQNTNLTGQRLGFSQEIIDQALRGSAQSMRDFKDAYDGALSPEQIAKLTALQRSWTKLEQTGKTLGTDVLTSIAPAFTAAADGASKWALANRSLADTLTGILAAIVSLKALKPVGWLLKLLGMGRLGGLLGGAARLAGPLGVAAGLAYANAPTTANEGEENIYENGKMTAYGRKITGQGGRASAAEREAWIREEAIKRVMNPDVAMIVARSEGFDNFNSAIPGEQSFGSFQLHVTPGGRGHAVGDEFQRMTGLNPADPSTEHEQIKFALDHAKRNGWHDFHGAARVGIGDRQGIEVTVENINIHTDSKDPRRHGALVADGIRDRMASNIANNANTGQRP